QQQFRSEAEQAQVGRVSRTQREPCATGQSTQGLVRLARIVGPGVSAPAFLSLDGFSGWVQWIQGPSVAQRHDTVKDIARRRRIGTEMLGREAAQPCHKLARRQLRVRVADLDEDLARSET